jgi:hypothetical protein
MPAGPPRHGQRRLLHGQRAGEPIETGDDDAVRSRRVLKRQQGLVSFTVSYGDGRAEVFRAVPSISSLRPCSPAAVAVSGSRPLLA